MPINQQTRTAIIERSARAIANSVNLPRRVRQTADDERNDQLTSVQVKAAFAAASAATSELFDLLNSLEAELEKLRAAQINWLKPIRRWTDRRKAEVLGAIAAGRVTEAEAIATYGLYSAELNRWRERLGQDGGYVGRCYGRDGSDRMYR